ncbi:MAG: glycosyltransferase family 2 protein [Bacteroidales bacterium]
MDKKPLISICCLAYNHAPFIRECLNGFIMQKTTFKIEVLIHDDASTDGTADIIREYESKYPDIIKPIYQTENQYSKGNNVVDYNFNRVKGKYVATCEGDDYWIDPLKLQKQADFLEAHPEVALCCHHYKIYRQNEAKFVANNYPTLLTGNEAGFFFTNNDRINEWFCSTLTVMYRSDLLSVTSEKRKLYSSFLDLHLFYYLLKNSCGYYMKDTMAVYRIHNGGIWSGLDSDQEFFKGKICFTELYNNEKDDYTRGALIKRVESRFYTYLNQGKYIHALMWVWKLSYHLDFKHPLSRKRDLIIFWLKTICRSGIDTLQQKKPK